MNKDTNVATVEVIKSGDKLSMVNFVMPIWFTKLDDETFKVDIPLLGISTVAYDEQDIDAAVSEASHSFVIASERFGNGVEKELENVGWKLENNKAKTPKKHVLNVVSHKSSIEDRLFKTGTPTSLRLNFA